MLSRVVRHLGSWRGLIGIVALLVALVSPAGTGADAVPPGPGGLANHAVDPGGQQRGNSTDIVGADGTSGVHVEWNASCPDSSPPGTAPGNYWSVQASVKRADGTTAVYDSAAYGPGPPTSAPPGQNSFDLQVNMRRDPSGKPVRRETFTWTVTLVCHNQATTIGSGTFTLCSGATAASGITEEEATKLLNQDVSTAENIVTPRLSKPVNQCQFDGLTDFFFNIGRQALYGNAAKKDFAPSHIAKDLRGGDYANVPADMLRYDKNDPELRRRRQMDADTFATQACDGC